MLNATTRYAAAVGFAGATVLLSCQLSVGQNEAPQGRLRVDPPLISTDKAVQYDYDIVYVRAPRVVKGRDGKD
jgi:hypothetical protein